MPLLRALMIEFARLPIEERDPYFVEVANRRRRSPLFVEKDFWVCFSLHIIFSTTDLADWLVFKGGTSLSKVFGAINRFSEDVDLSISPSWLGFAGQDSPDAARSHSKFDKRWKALNTECSAAVEARVQPILEQSIEDALGRAPDGRAYLEFKLDEQTNSPVLNFRYPTAARHEQRYVNPQVKLELGSLTDQRPVGSHTVTPWVAEEFPAVFSAPSCRVVALEMERTFWEKVTILHAEYHRPADRPMRSRLSRHYYDVHQMSEHPSGRRAMHDSNLLARVVRYKRMYFKSGWASYETAVPGTLRLVPPKHRLADLKTDYRQMQPMFTEPPPSFDQILDHLSGLEESINRGELT
jgi:nucleotidyltransferase AbiEii toxin of type IV toxin-antitoxin system